MKKKTVIISELEEFKQKIAELEYELKEASKYKDYTLGLYDELRKQHQEQMERQREQISSYENLINSRQTEVDFLRDLVMQLTLSPEKLEILNKERVTMQHPLDPNLKIY